MSVPKAMSRDEVRDVDRRAIEHYGLPGIVLMENAGRGCVDWIEQRGISGPVVICAGRGNNGGDGFVIARHLENRGHDVKVLLFSDPALLRGDAATNFHVLERAGSDIHVYSSTVSEHDWDASLIDADWVVDALLGTGTRGGLRDPFPAIIRAINRSQATRIAIDLPSGLDCDTGIPVDPDQPIAIEATCTATFVSRKLGFENPDSVRFTGDVRVIDIGVPQSMFD